MQVPGDRDEAARLTQHADRFSNARLHSQRSPALPLKMMMTELERYAAGSNAMIAIAAETPHRAMA
jgi:hypothetical protein